MTRPKPPDTQPGAVVLLSGGLDSATCLHLVRAEGYRAHAISFRYGQRHRWELEAAQRLARALPVERHLILDLDLAAIGGSALTGDGPVPKDGKPGAPGDSAIPVTYVPARNTVFLALALAWAEVLRVSDLFIGVNAVDYSGYPDCRPAFIEAFERTANLATRSGVEGRPFRIQTPLMRCSKGEIIRKGLALGVDFSLTRSCYDLDDGGLSCGRCDACRLRLAGFAEAGETDPAPYRP